MSRNAALEVADEHGLDLVCVAPNAKMPVCKIMDYSKFRYDQMKKAKEAAEDAASAKRLADAFLEIDLKSLQFAAQKFMLKMAALSKVVLR